MMANIITLIIIIGIGLFILKVFHDIMMMGVFFLGVFIAFYIGKKRISS